MIRTKKMILPFLVVLNIFVIDISSLPTPMDKKNIFKRQAVEINEKDVQDDSDYNDDLNEKIISIADTSSRIIENLISTLSSSAKIISDIFEAKIRIAEPILLTIQKRLKEI